MELAWRRCYMKHGRTPGRIRIGRADATRYEKEVRALLAPILRKRPVCDDGKPMPRGPRPQLFFKGIELQVAPRGRKGFRMFVAPRPASPNVRNYDQNDPISYEMPRP